MSRGGWSRTDTEEARKEFGSMGEAYPPKYSGKNYIIT